MHKQQKQRAFSKMKQRRKFLDLCTNMTTKDQRFSSKPCDLPKVDFLALKALKEDKKTLQFSGQTRATSRWL